MRRSHNQSFLAQVEALEARRLLHGDSLEPPCDVIGSDDELYCCWEYERDWHGYCPGDPEYDPDGPPDGPNPPPPEPEEPDPEDPNPNDPPLPNPDPCAGHKLTIDLVYEGMREENITNPPHPQHEMNPGGYLPLNRGFSEWYAHWHEPGVGGGPVPTTPPFEDLALDFYEDFENNARLITGSLGGVVLDPQLRTGSVSISTSGGFTLPAGKRVPFGFSVPSGVDLWIFYDPDADGPDPAEWNHVGAGEKFYAGDKRPMSFNLTYEGDDPGLDQTVTARAAVTAYCTPTYSWRVLRARDDVKLHVVETELTADSTNDDGLDQSAGTWATIEDDYVEWLNQERNVPSPGKLLSVNDEDPGGPTVPDWADGFNADGVTGGTPGDDSSPQAAFTPIQVTLPGWNHGLVQFRFIYDAADPHFSSQADPSARVDPADMRRTGSVADGNIRYDMGTGKMRLWTEDGSIQRSGFDVNNGGDFVDSQEWDVATSTQKPVYYTHSDFGLSSASGGTITLWVEALRPSLALGDRLITLQAVYAAQHTNAQGNTQTLLAHSYTESKLIPLTVVDVDLDIDSDNTNTLDRSDYEDMLEDVPTLPGKFIAVNDDDTDGDSIIDWADFNGIQGEQFVPLNVILPAGVDLAGAMIRFEYAGSDPGTIDPLNLPGQPLPGTLRLWNKPGADARSPLIVGNVPSNNAEGNYVMPGVDFPVAVLFPNGVRQITLWAEAVRVSAAMGDQRIEVKLTLDTAANAWINTATIQPDWVRLTAGVAIDADVDSDNNNGFGPPNHTKPEDDVEDVQNDKTKPGKLLVANDDDGDLDGIPDFADGMNLFGDQSNDNAPPTVAQGERFAWFTLELPPILDLSRVRLKFEYDGSDPQSVTRAGAGTLVDPYTYTAAAGALRLWKEEGHETRDANNIQQDFPGDYVAPTPGANDFYSGATLEDLGFSATVRRIDLWLEALTPSAGAGDEAITVKIDPDGAGGSGFVLEDRVRFTSTQVAFVSDFGIDNLLGNSTVNAASDAPASFARIGHWGADSGANKLSGYDATTNLVLNSAAGVFIDSDPDRFFVRMVNVLVNANPGAPDTIDLSVGTYEGAVVQDNQTMLRLVENGNNTNVFVSESHLLTGPNITGVGATDQDDGFQVWSARTAGNVTDNDANDRTHWTIIDGGLQLEWGPDTIVRRVPVNRRGQGTQDERRNLPVQVHNFNEPWKDVGIDGTPGTGDLGESNGAYDLAEPFLDVSAGSSAFGITGTYGVIWTDSEIDRMLSAANSVLSQLGISVDEIAPRLTHDPVSGLFAHSLGLFEAYRDPGTLVWPSSDEVIIQSNFRSAANLNTSHGDDVVDLYFVAPINLGAWGVSWSAGLVALNYDAGTLATADPTLFNRSYIGLSADRNDVLGVTAHEILHLLTNHNQDTAAAWPDYMNYPQDGAGTGFGATVESGRRVRRDWETKARLENLYSSPPSAPGAPSDWRDPGNPLLKPI